MVLYVLPFCKTTLLISVSCFRKSLHPWFNRYKGIVFVVKINDLQFVEDDSGYGLPQLMAEISRWRTVINAEYSQRLLTTHKVRFVRIV